MLSPACSPARSGIALFTVLVASISVTLGCGPASRSDPEFWAPWLGGGGAPAEETASEASSSASDASSQEASVAASSSGPGSTSSSAGGGAPSTGALAFDFKTISFGGKYAPKNIGAVWVTDDQDVFVKTLEVWAAKRAKHLVKWRAASANNVVDAVTGATKSAHVAHQSTWDGTGVDGQPMLDGAYRVYVEFTEQNSADQGKQPGPWMAVDFVKGPEPQDLVLPDQTSFTSIHLIYQ